MAPNTAPDTEPDTKPDTKPDTVEVFWSGLSQAMRLPEAVRFEDAQVRIRREVDRVTGLWVKDWER
jgi:hypothetical protein